MIRPFTYGMKPVEPSPAQVLLFARQCEAVRIIHRIWRAEADAGRTLSQARIDEIWHAIVEGAE